MPRNHQPLFPVFFLILLSFLRVKSCDGLSALDLNLTKAGESGEMGKGACTGKTSQCPGMSVDEEEMMDSNINRRVLAMQKRYISYDTLKRDQVPCTQPGASYYNCKPPGVANTYHRGCEVITRCRGD